MMQKTLRAVFMRGGTSKGLFFHSLDLPADCSARDAAILAAMGSPDRFERQLDGMGGGVSSLSKIMIVGRSAQPEFDVEFRFGQVSIRDAVIHYQGNCGNLTGAVAAFAVDEGLVVRNDGQAKLKMLNLNTGNVVLATLGIKDGEALVDGDFVVDGVSGSGAPIQLDFLDPAGTEWGKLFPTESHVDIFEVQGIGRFKATIMDAVAAVVFVKSEVLGLSGQERPVDIHANQVVMTKLEAIGAAAATRIGAVGHIPAGKSFCPLKPSISLVSAAGWQTNPVLDCVRNDEADVYVQSISMGVPHRAIPIGAAMCAAVAAKVDSTVVNELIEHSVDGRPIRIGHPAGLCSIDAVVSNAGELHVASITTSRTARRLMSGMVYVPKSRICQEVQA